MTIAHSLLIILPCIAVSAITAAVTRLFYRSHWQMSSANSENSTISDQGNSPLSLGKKELEIVFDTIPEEIFIIDKEFRINRANKSCAASLQQPIQHLIGKTCYRLFWERDTCCDDCPATSVFNKKIPVIRKSIIRCGSDKIRHYEVSSFPVINDSGDTYHAIEIRRDVTDEKKMLEHLIQSEKLSSIGKMTTGLAHEMNNPLSGISGNAENLLRSPKKYGLNEKGLARINAILTLASRATAIMTDVLHLSQRPEQLFILLNINDLLLETINNLHITEEPDIELMFHFDKNLPHLYCDPSKIKLVAEHLMTNAIQAIAEKKRLDHNALAYKGLIAVATQLKDNKVLITFTDNGCGISIEYQSKIFDPFFSTKPTGQGTGLGLCVSNKYIEEHGGRLSFECVDNKTIFSVLLPLQQNRICQP